MYTSCLLLLAPSLWQEDGEKFKILTVYLQNRNKSCTFAFIKEA